MFHNLLKQKVMDELRGTLNSAVQSKLEAESQRDAALRLQTELISRLSEVDREFLELRQVYFRVSRENEMLTADNQSEKLRALDLENEVQNLNETLNSKDFEISKQASEIEELKITLEKLSDVRNVLNRVYNSSSLLKGKSVFEEKPKSREPPLKKEGFLTNEDDFWYSDIDHNNNQRTFSGRKIQLPPLNQDELEYTKLSDKKKKKW